MFTLKAKFILFFICTLIPNYSNASKNVVVKELTCDHNKERINNVTCNINQKGPEHTLDLSATLLKEVKDVIVHLEILKNTGPHSNLIVNVTEDFCSFMESTATTFYTEIVVKMFRDISNIDHKCPYNGYIYVDGINPDPRVLPSGIPNGEYVVNIKFYEYKPENILGSVKIVSELKD